MKKYRWFRCNSSEILFIINKAGNDDVGLHLLLILYFSQPFVLLDGLASLGTVNFSL